MSDHVGFARVFIELINENDNRPIFSRPLYNISLPENTPPGTSLLRVLVSVWENRGAVFTQQRLWWITHTAVYCDLFLKRNLTGIQRDYNKTWLAPVNFMGLVLLGMKSWCVCLPHVAQKSLETLPYELWFMVTRARQPQTKAQINTKEKLIHLLYWVSVSQRWDLVY